MPETYDIIKQLNNKETFSYYLLHLFFFGNKYMNVKLQQKNQQQQTKAKKKTNCQYSASTVILKFIYLNESRTEMTKKIKLRMCDLLNE